MVKHLTYTQHGTRLVQNGGSTPSTPTKLRKSYEKSFNPGKDHTDTMDQMMAVMLLYGSDEQKKQVMEHLAKKEK